MFLQGIESIAQNINLEAFTEPASVRGRLFLNSNSEFISKSYGLSDYSDIVLNIDELLSSIR